MKKILIMLSAMLMLSGCVKTETIIKMPTLPVFTKPENVPFADPKGVVSTPDTQAIWTVNQLLENHDNAGTFTLDNGIIVSYNVYRYGGLVNDAVETKINDKIMAIVHDVNKYADMDTLPTYQGMYKVHAKDSITITGLSVNTYTYFNFDNLLSVEIDIDVHTNIEAVVNGIETGNFVYTNHITFDLNTGDEVHLSDLFVNGTDYVSLLNGAVLTDAAAHSDPVESWDYSYLGGFSGIRGDIQFSLSMESLKLFFDHTYPEFSNRTYPTQVDIPYSSLKGLLAFQTRFASKTNLFTDKTIITYSNYNTPADTKIDVSTQDQTKVQTIITTYSNLTGLYAKIRDQQLAKYKALIAQAVKDKASDAYLEFNASPSGPYMNLIAGLNITKNGIYTNTNDKVTYKPDGSILTFADVFKPGVDYKSIIIAQMKVIYTEEGFTETYDYEEVFKTMRVMIFDWQGKGSVRVFNRFFAAPAWDEGIFDISFSIADRQDILLIKPW